MLIYSVTETVVLLAGYNSIVVLEMSVPQTLKLPPPQTYNPNYVHGSSLCVSLCDNFLSSNIRAFRCRPSRLQPLAYRPRFKELLQHDTTGKL